MNKEQLVKEISEDLEISTIKADKFVDSFINAIKKGVITDGEVRIRSFIKFERAVTKKLIDYNFKTCEAIKILPREKVKVKFSNKFLSSLDE